MEDAGAIIVRDGVVSTASLVMNGAGRIDHRGSAGILYAKMNSSGLINVRLLALTRPSRTRIDAPPVGSAVRFEVI